MTTTNLIPSAETKTFSLEGFSFTPTQLTVKNDTDFDEWCRIGEFIRLTNQASQWWWGDWLNMGEDKFGEQSSQALEVTRWDEETLRVYSWVCRRVPPVNRVNSVPFSHYLLLAKLPEDEQRVWAEQVSDNQWSRRQLRRAIKGDISLEMQPCVLVRCQSPDEADAVEQWAVAQHHDIERTERTRKE